MRFCGNCGTRLPDDAPAADPAPAPLRAVDPAQLGVLSGADLLDRFRRAGLEAKGQRRSVTVLFVDLSEYTQLSEMLGDEALYELVQRFIRVLVDDVYKYEGMVDKLTGDGLMALFGAPIAHENNAERALRSALDMVADVERLSAELDLPGRALRVHVGLNAGTVIVGGVGGDGLMNYTAIGDSVNLARRLEEAAAPGEILVSESLYRQARRLFDFEPLPPLTLKNVSRPVKAYRVIGAKDQPGSTRGLEGLRAPMIGRENEFRQVQEMVERLVSDGQGGLVLLVGEGGMGKSRLTSEIKASLDLTRLRVLEGQSLTYRKSIAYWIFQDVLRSYLGLTSSAPEGQVRQRLAERTEAVLGAEAREKLAYLETLMSLAPSDPAAAGRIRYLTAGQLRQQIFMAVRDLLQAEARRQPLLLVLEDLHWADDASLDLLRFLLETTLTSPLLIYAISRPFDGGGIQAIHERAGQRLAGRYLFLRLQALPPDQSAQLLQALLTVQDLPDALREMIIQRSAGLPFYLEEILRMLIDNNVIYLDRGAGGGRWRLSAEADLRSIGVPETLQGLILARFDRLAPAQRRLLQTASVVGYEFSEPVLRSVIAMSEQPGDQAHGETPLNDSIQETLEYLVEHEYIEPVDRDGDNPPADTSAGDSYVFRHVLVSDAVYSTLLQRDRRELHTRAGQAIEKIYAGRLDGQIEVLAGHYLRSTMLDRALHYLILAGQKAARSYANEQARQHFTQALEVLNKVDHSVEQEVQVYLGLGDVLLTAGDYPAAREIFTRGLNALGAKAGTGSLGQHPSVDWVARKQQVSLLQRKIAQTHESQGDYETALVFLGAAQRLIDGGEEQLFAERASVLSDIGWIHFRRGSIDQAEVGLRQALALAERGGAPDVLASVLNRLAGVFFQRDDPEKATEYLSRSLVLREQIGDVVGVARSYNNLGLLNWKQGDLAGALKNFEHSSKLQSNLGDVEGLIVLRTNMGMIEIDLGELEAAERHFQEALQSATQIGHPFHQCEARMHLALLCIYAGEWRRALEHGQLAMAGFQELGVQENMLDLNVSLGWAYLGLGDYDHLEEITQHISELIKENGEGDPGSGEGRAHRLFGRIALQRGDQEAARAALEKSAAIFAMANNGIERSRVLVDLAGVLAECGDRPGAAQALKEARETFERVGARLDLERLENTARALALG